MAAQSNGNTTTAIVIIAGALLFYDKIFGKSEAETKADKAESQLLDVPQEKNPTLPNYKVKAKAGYITIRKNIGSLIGPQLALIKKAIGAGIYVSQNDVTAIINAFKVCRTKSEVNVLFRSYSTLYKRDLITDLQTSLTAPNKERIYTFINSLPDYLKLK